MKIKLQNFIKKSQKWPPLIYNIIHAAGRQEQGTMNSLQLVSLRSQPVGSVSDPNYNADSDPGGET